MDNSTQEKINKAIKESLPSQVGEILKTELERIPKLENQLKELNDLVIDKNNTIKRLESKLKELEYLEGRERVIDSKEKALEKAERDLKIKELEYKLNSETEKTNFAKDVALGLVRNTNYRKIVFDNINAPHTDQHGNQVYRNTTKNYDEAKTEE